MRNRKTIRPQLESFEDRLTPAGNVSASFGEVLQLRGDDAANSVRISQASNGTIVITGLNGTRINGRTSVSGSGSIEKFDALLFGGNDRLEIRNLFAQVDQNIEMGAGNDTVILKGAGAGVNFTVKTDGGTDRVEADSVFTGSGDFKIETGEGNSTVNVLNSEIGKALTVIGGIQADLVTIRDTIVAEDLSVESKEGADRIELNRVNVGKNLTVNAGNGNDFVFVKAVSAAFDATLLGEDSNLDTLKNRGIDGGTKLEIKGFERFV